MGHCTWQYLMLYISRPTSLSVYLEAENGHAVAYCRACRRIPRAHRFCRDQRSTQQAGLPGYVDDSTVPVVLNAVARGRELQLRNVDCIGTLGCGRRHGDRDVSGIHQSALAMSWKSASRRQHDAMWRAALSLCEAAGPGTCQWRLPFEKPSISLGSGSQPAPCDSGTDQGRSSHEQRIADDNTRKSGLNAQAAERVDVTTSIHM